MALWSIQNSTLADIADAVRAKRGTSSPIQVNELADEIALIEGDGLLRDRLIIPDKYNTGCHGTLKKFDVSTDTSGIGWRDNTTMIDFNNSNSVKNLQDNQVIVFENYDFTDYDAFNFYLANAYTSEKSYYKDNLRFVFKNCLFLTVAQSYAFPETTNISLEFYDCSFSRIVMNKAIVDRCLIGNRTYYKSIIPNYDPGADGGNILGGHVNLRNSYIMDIEVETETQSGAHLDGIQMFQSGTDVHISNCRFECFDMPYEYSNGNWSYSLYLENQTTDSSLNYCIFHGGGYYNTSLEKADNQSFANNFITSSNDYNSPCYPSENNWQMADNWASYIDTLLVSSVWVDGNKIKICYSNDLNSERTLRIVTDTNVTYTETVPACPTRSGATSQTVTKWSDLPFDLIKEIDASGVHNINIYDGNTLIRTYTVETAGNTANTGDKSIIANGTYTSSTDNLDGYSKVIVNVPPNADLGTKSITLNGTYTATSDNLDGYSSVTVNVDTGLSPSYVKNPIEFDYDNGYVSAAGVWTYEYPSNNRSDIYAVESGKKYILVIGNTAGNRARGIVTDTDVRTLQAGDTVQGTYFGSASPAAGMSFTITPEVDGYIVFQKTNQAVNGILTYLYCTDEMTNAEPSGSKTITTNGDGIDVAGYAQVDVHVPVSADLGTKSVTANGTYNASSDHLDGYSSVTVEVPQPSGVIQITQNGTYDVTQYASAVVTGSGGYSYITSEDVTISENSLTFEADYDPTKVVEGIMVYNLDRTESQRDTAIGIVYTNYSVTSPTNYGLRIYSDYQGNTRIVTNGYVDPTFDSTTGKVTIAIGASGNAVWRAGRTYRVIIMYDTTPQRELVPQTGTWQFKTTPTKGYIIVGKDDDDRDSAEFVRMVNGYGYPVVLNSIQQKMNYTIDSDSDSEYSTYPSGSVSHFPNGGKIIDLYEYIVANPELGEIALHGDADDQLWDSDNLTGEVLDTMYETYVNGGGLKTKEEMKTAIMNTYAETDIAQGAVRVLNNRDALEEHIGTFVYTIGTWGGSFDFIVDGITVGNCTDVPNTNYRPLARTNNFMGYGTLKWDPAKDIQTPYNISRISNGLQPANVATMCQRAYDYQCCIDIFHHYYLDGTKEKWDDFKEAMDILKTYVDNNIVEVVTRKQYYDLGEFVEHPITGIGLEVAQVSYPTGTTLTDSEFTCTYTLDNGTVGTCANDRILDYSNVDTTTEGTYTATLKYRGKSTTCNVVISNSQPIHYLIENGSYSGTGDMPKDVNYGTLDPAITYEAGKNYRIQFHFKANCTTMYDTHYFEFIAPRSGSYIGWRTSDTFHLDTTNGVTEGDVIVNLSASQTKSIDGLISVSRKQNTTVTEWWFTSVYVYEVQE